MSKFEDLFHGTSSIHLASIRNHGLMTTNSRLHLTTHPMVAFLEALWTVDGEKDLPGGYKKAAGGAPIVIAVDRRAVSDLRVDTEYFDRPPDRKNYRISSVRFAFVTECPVDDCSALRFFEGSRGTLADRCRELLREVGQTSKYAIFEGIGVNLVRRRVFWT